MSQTPSSLLIRNARAIATGLPGAAMRHDTAALGGDLRIREGAIAAIGRLAPEPGERVIDASDCVVLPGWVNTHHHLFQSLLKGIPAGIDQPLLRWLAEVPVPYRRHFDQEAVLRLAARIGMAELLLSGCTTVADHQYHYGPGVSFDASAALFDEAGRLGLRFVLCRGTQTLRQRYDLDPPPQCRPETLEQYFAALEHDVRRFHDPAPRAMRRMVSAPTTPNWSVSAEQMKPIAREARRLGLRLHSHLSETADYVKWAREAHGCTPLEFVERHEWVGPDVWFAHMVHLSDAEIARCAATGTGTAHCPQSNARLGSGVAPVPKLLAAGAPVSLGVDGAASNEAADMLSEAHAAWLVHRAVGGAGAITAEQVVEMGCAGGGRILGLDVGTLVPGAAADLAVYRLDRPSHFGLHDAAMAPVLSGAATRVQTVVVQGRVVVDGGLIPGLDLDGMRRDAMQAVALMRAAH